MGIPPAGRRRGIGNSSLITDGRAVSLSLRVTVTPRRSMSFAWVVIGWNGRPLGADLAPRPALGERAAQHDEVLTRVGLEVQRPSESPGLERGRIRWCDWKGITPPTLARASENRTVSGRSPRLSAQRR